MSKPVETQRTEATFEEIVELIIAGLKKQGALPASRAIIPWDAFLRLSDLIHENFTIPSTTFTPIMRRLLFALGLALKPRNIVGVGTYVGYTFSWLLRHRANADPDTFFEKAIGIDIDSEANSIARRNCAVLGHAERLAFIDADGVSALAMLDHPVDLLYLDLDDPHTGKAGYKLSLEAATSRLRPGSLILAHDACVPKFAGAFAEYHEHVRKSGFFTGPWILPVDNCGLSIVAMK